MKKIAFIAAAAAATVTFGVGTASADHSVVTNPSGCHETNRNGGVPNANSGQEPATSGWHNSAGGHDRAKEVSAVHSGGDADGNCPA